MKKRPTLLITLLSLAFVVGALLVAFQVINAQQRALPEVSFQTLQGEGRQLESFRGEPFLVNVWATWCPPCVREMPLLADLDASHEELQVVLVNHGETPERIEDFLEEMGLNLQHLLLDPRGELVAHSGHRGLPVTYFYNAQGHLVATQSGEVTREDLADLLPRMGVNFYPERLP
ncbi:Thiol-disulfide isomerase or thioredoxin [Marinospirillum celere]|uniref:Thiol-disulfide isomerase or thioredoxin n=1 Tax=Marinospirillum celere TaxID=1122252 RepID=A0A1I1H7C0_9GAMM|nr:TlpA disulfide reductase family protein [Marinospirillum celere]SFC19666.1 Thiol-disulfide isomerase or thioredoxin [Marinospirillum celere]